MVQSEIKSSLTYEDLRKLWSDLAGRRPDKRYLPARYEAGVTAYRYILKETPVQNPIWDGGLARFEGVPIYSNVHLPLNRLRAFNDRDEVIKEFDLF